MRVLPALLLSTILSADHALAGIPWPIPGLDTPPLPVKPNSKSLAVELRGLSTTEAVFNAAKTSQPIRVTSRQRAAKFFDADGLKKLGQSVDFEKQVVLIFASQRMLHVATGPGPMFVVKSPKPPTAGSRVHVFVVPKDVNWGVLFAIC